jgi:hypothetical protein
MKGGQSEHGIDDLPAPAEPAAPLTCLRAPPRTGDYVYSPSIDLWTNRRIASEGQEILLAGRSRRPSEEHARLWGSIEARLEALVAKAVAAIQVPPGMPRSSRFSREELSLSEVRMESGGAVEFFFDTPLGDDLDMWPMATFLDFDLQGWEWVA